MSRVLYIGDPHIKPDCLDEGKKLIKYICDISKANGVNHVMFLGDLFHTHSIIHLSVLGFWKWAFECLSNELPEISTWALVGNHDISGKLGDYNNSLMLFDESKVNVVSEPRNSPWGALLMPYVQDGEHFIETSNLCKEDNKILICHQTFLGSKYENGIFAKDGVDPNLVDFDEIISGHIHTPQVVGKVWYPGSPRWQTIADANVDRAIWIVDHSVNKKIEFRTEGVCKPIYSLVEKEGERVKIPDGNVEIIVDIIGSENYVKGRALELESLGVKVRRFPIVSRNILVKESDGLLTSFNKFIAQFKSKLGTSNERLSEIASERISWLKKAT